MKPDSLFYAQTLEILKRSDLSGNLAEPVLRDMLPSFQRETWKKGSVVMDPEKTTEKFYLLTSGRVKVTRVNPDTGREFTLSLLGPGDGFDVVSLLDSKKHRVSVVALDDIETLAAAAGVMRNWIEAHPEFNKAFLLYLGKQIRQISDLASDLALCDTGTRLAKLFLQHAAQDSRHPRLSFIRDLSHEELAHMIGSVRTVVNRYLQRLKKEGIIIAKRGRLEIKEMHALVEKIEKHLE